MRTLQAEFPDYRERACACERIADFQTLSFIINDEGSEPERVPTVRLSAVFFETLGMQLTAGVFTEYKEQAGRNGKTLTLNGSNATIVGIMPASFQFPRDA
ncbi:MAG: hypothetical protein LC803_23435 [Acidobacteria bacterium]|nr:hypothetical protein [Acidobacteriota bacterium]